MSFMSTEISTSNRYHVARPANHLPERARAVFQKWCRENPQIHRHRSFVSSRLTRTGLEVTYLVHGEVPLTKTVEFSFALVNSDIRKCS